MGLRRWVILAVLLAVSCQNQRRQSEYVSSGGRQTQASAKSEMEKAGESAPPKDAKYTILCFRFQDAVHVERANRVKAALMRSTGMKDWYVIHENDQSLLYYGYYRAINDPKDSAETARAQEDRKKIANLTDETGGRPFRQAVFVELTAPDPEAPPEWNLVNAKGAYSLQIGVYMGSPQRKQAAVDAVRAARQQGIEAYYYHGEGASAVCVGVWPASAVRIVESPGGISTARSVAGGGQILDVSGPKVEILDPTLRATMQKYPYTAVNGMLMKTIVNGIARYDPSLLVPIPHPRELTQPVQPLPQDVPVDQPMTQTPPAGLGKLKSIGD